MRVLLQRVTRAEVRVDRQVVGSIGRGLVALVGVGRRDTAEVAQSLAAKTVALRIFADDDGRTNRSLMVAGGAVLAVSQFTLYADTRRGRRPSFLDAAPPEHGEALYRSYAEGLEALGVTVARGVFGASMEVELVNDGPMSIWLDSDT
ncbi:MAG: D-tyrosyl-tRNA(Tyr) deacylase [Chloroflexi bacterium]|nr:D-tyrosyl-tRNA(Tyr) deacylase [Chloroflexota bacterium]